MMYVKVTLNSESMIKDADRWKFRWRIKDKNTGTIYEAFSICLYGIYDDSNSGHDDTGKIDSGYTVEVWLQNGTKIIKDFPFCFGACCVGDKEYISLYSDNGKLYTNFNSIIWDNTNSGWNNPTAKWSTSNPTDNWYDKYIFGHGYDNGKTVIDYRSTGGQCEMVLGTFKNTVKFNGGDILSVTGENEKSCGENAEVGSIPEYTINAGKTFKNWVIDKDVTLNDGTVIEAGVQISEEDITKIKVVEPLTITPFYHVHDGMNFERVLTSRGGELEEGSYVLEKDIELTNDIIIPKGKTVKICLNGYSLKGTGSGSVITNNGSLTICDCHPEQEHKFSVDEATGKWTLDKDNGTETVYGGVITGGYVANTNETTGGGIQNNGRLTLEGGTVIGNSAYNGAGVFNNSYLNITGGSISHNVAENGGGGIKNHGMVTMSDGSVSNNIGKFGGGINNNNKAYLSISGGTISGNKAIYTNSEGGGITNYKNSTIILSGGSVTGNTSAKDGGGIFSNSGTVTVSGGSVDKNEAVYGGGIDVSGGVLNVNGGVINKNQATATGGGIAVYNSVTSTSLTGGTVENNTAEEKGGGVYYNGGTVKLGGDIVIQDNKLTKGDKNNLLISSNPVSVDTANPLADGAKVGVTRSGGTGAIAGNGTAYNQYTKYFTSDSENTLVKFNSNYNYIQLIDGTSLTYTYTLSENDTVTVKVKSGTKTVLEESLTITAEDAPYDGKPHGADFSGATAFMGGELPEITYEGTSGTTYGPSKDAPSAYGSYKATFTFENADGGVVTAGTTYSITLPENKIEWKIKDWEFDNSTDHKPTVKSVEYGDISNVVFLYAEKGSTDFSADVPTKVGEYTVKALLKGNGVYADFEETKDFAITKVENEIDWEAGWVYDGSDEHKPTVNSLKCGEISDIEFWYAKKGSTEFSKDVPTAAGEYTVKAVLKAGDTFTNIEETEDFTIAKADNVFTWDITSWTYGEAGNEPTISAPKYDTAASIVTEYSVKGSENYSTEKPTAAGEYSVKVSYEGNDNINDYVATQDFTIAKKQLTVENTAVKAEKVYDGEEKAEIISVGTPVGVESGDNVTLEAVAYYKDASAGDNKAVTVEYTISGDDTANYIAPENNTSLTASITKKTLTVEGTKVEDKVYDGTTAATIVDNGTPKDFITGDIVEVSAVGIFADAKAETNKKVTVQYTLSGEDSCNYTVENGELTANITAKDGGSFTVTGIEDKTYTGEAITQNITVKDGEKVLEENTDYEVSYQDNTNTGTGAAKVKIIFKGNYTGEIDKTFTINKGKYNVPELNNKIILKITNNSVSLSDIDVDVEDAKVLYSIDGKQTWQENTDFEGLEPNKSYDLYVKIIGTDNYDEYVSEKITFTTKKNQYTVKWINDGEVLEEKQIEEGETPVYTGKTPVKASDDDYDYTFRGWSSEISPVTGNTVYSAVFDKTPCKGINIVCILKGAKVDAGSTTTVRKGQPVHIKFTADEGKCLPSEISVVVGNKKLNSDDYTYNSATGELDIKAGIVYDEVTITMNAKKADVDSDLDSDSDSDSDSNTDSVKKTGFDTFLEWLRGILDKIKAFLKIK